VDHVTGRATYRDVFAVGEFRALWLAQLLSVAGDQLARVALTVLVYDRTRSALLAAVTYAVTIIPVFAGGVLLSGLADRLPRRTVMITCDLARAGLVLVMVIPGIPLTGLVALLFAVTLFTAPFTAARSALYPDILDGDRYVLGTAVTMTTFPARAGGRIRGRRRADRVHQRPGVPAGRCGDLRGLRAAGRHRGAGPPGGRRGRRWLAPLADAVAGIRLVFNRPGLRTPMLFGWLASFAVVPEGLAAPLARRLHGGDVLTGLVLAATALGIAAGAVAFSRLVPAARRGAWLGPLAVACCLVLVLLAARPPAAATLAVLFGCGALGCYQIAANAAFVAAAPPAQRSQAFGLAQAGMYLGQGGAVILAGAAAARIAPTVVIAASGALGAVTALVLAIGNRSMTIRPAETRPSDAIAER
jgi:MFS family permease